MLGFRWGLLASALTLLSCQPHWQNYLDDYRTEGERYRPGSVSEVLSIVTETARRNGRVRAVGSGHSSADVARPAPSEAWIEVSRLNQIQPWSHYRPMPSDETGEAPEKRYVRIGAGASVKQANALLAARGRALYNMGNYDAQTLAGAFSTGTHGSGIRHGPMADRIVAIELVTDEKDPQSKKRVQRLLRLEPSDGVTDPARFAQRGETVDGVPLILEQNDATFRAALINLGAFGVIVNVTVDTRPTFFLEETETVEFWSRAAPPKVEQLAKGYPEFFMMQVAPHEQLSGPDEGRVAYIKTVRREVRLCDERAGKRPPSREDLGRLWAWFAGTKNIELLSLNRPAQAQSAILKTFDQRQHRPKPFSSRSDLVHINSLAPFITATSIDVWVPLDRATSAIDHIIELAKAKGTVQPITELDLARQYWHTSPLGIRVVGASQALLAPSYDGARVSIEIPLLMGVPERAKAKTDEGVKRLTREEYEKKGNEYRMNMLQFLMTELTGPTYGGRPHWGQRNWMTAEFAAKEYGANWDCWVTQYRRFNAYDTFSNSFTERMCLSNSDRPECAKAPVRPPPQACDGI